MAKIPFLSFEGMHRDIQPEMEAEFSAFLKDGWFVLGERLNTFEKAYADFNRCTHAIGVSNGLDALFLSLKALGIGPGDEVIVPSHTYIATWLAVSHVGATPVPVEPDVRTYNIDPDKIEAAITPRTKAIMPVHLYGQACDMESIMQIAQRHNLFVVEDNAQSHGATWNGHLTGTFGQLNATSFYPGKNLGALGDAGAITTQYENWANEVRKWRNYGSSVKYVNELPGYNMRMDELQAGLLNIKLKKLHEWTGQRQAVAQKYLEILAGNEDIVLPHTHANASHVYHLFVIRTQNRDGLQQHLTENGVGTLIHYPIPPHLQKAYEHLGYKAGDFPIAEELARTCLSLPMWPGFTDMEAVTEHLYSFA